MNRRSRKQILVDRRFQMQYLYIWLTVAIGLIVISVGFYFISRGLIGGVPSLDPIFIRLMIGISVFVILFSLLMGVLSVAMTHRVAGAAWRLDQCIHQIRRDNLNVSITLRKGDYLQSLAESLTELRDALKARRDVADGLLKEVEDMRMSLDPQISDDGKKKLEEFIEHLRQLTAPPEETQVREKSDATGG